MAWSTITPNRWVALTIATLLLTAALPLAAQEKAPDAWQFEVSPYVWLPGFDSTLHVGEGEAHSRAEVSDWMENLQFAFMAHLDARKGRWGMVVDPIYVSFGKAGYAPGSYGDIKVDVDLETLILGVGGYYRVHRGERANFDILLGGRYCHAATDLHFYDVTPDRHASANFWDPFVGFRGDARMGARWLFQYRGELTGLGAHGGTGWDAALRFDYRMTRVTSLSLGYGYMDMRFESGSGYGRIEMDLKVGGPYIGLAFHF